MNLDATAVPGTPHQLRELIARGEWARPTSGVLDDYQQANLAVVPRAHAYDFLLFCTRNPKSCPLIAVTEPGSPFVDGRNGPSTCAACCRVIGCGRRACWSTNPPT